MEAKGKSCGLSFQKAERMRQRHFYSAITLIFRVVCRRRVSRQDCVVKTNAKIMQKCHVTLAGRNLSTKTHREFRDGAAPNSGGDSRASKEVS